MSTSPITLVNYVAPQLLTVNPTIIWSLFGFILLIFAVVSAMVIYHWHTYGYAPKVASRAIKIYVIGSSIFILFALYGCITYSLSL